MGIGSITDSDHEGVYMLCYSHLMKAVFVWVTVCITNAYFPTHNHQWWMKNKSVPLFEPFEPFHSLIKNGVQFRQWDSFSKSFCFKKVIGKTKYGLPFTFLVFISDHCQDSLKDEVRIKISLWWLFRKIIEIRIDSRIKY